MCGLSGTLSCAVFVYLCICVSVFAHLTHVNIIFDTSEQSSFQKYTTCWVFLALCHVLYLCICVCVFVYETLGNISLISLDQELSENIWFLWSKTSYIVEISGDVTTAGRMDTRTTTRKYSATQLLISEKLSLAIEEAMN